MEENLADILATRGTVSIRSWRVAVSRTADRFVLVALQARHRVTACVSGWQLVLLLASWL